MYPRNYFSGPRNSEHSLIKAVFIHFSALTSLFSLKYPYWDKPLAFDYYILTAIQSAAGLVLLAQKGKKKVFKLLDELLSCKKRFGFLLLRGRYNKNTFF
jgi:hypothetical protein